MKSLSLVLVILFAAFTAGAQTSNQADTLKSLSFHSKKPDVTLGPNNGNPLFLVNGAVSAISRLNPEDISNLEISKDKDMSAEFGEASINGIVFITTKTKEETLPLPKAIAQYTGGNLSGKELFAINGLIIKKKDLPVATNAIQKIEIIKKDGSIYLNVVTVTPSPFTPKPGEIMIRGNAETARN